MRFNHFACACPSMHRWLDDVFVFGELRGVWRVHRKAAWNLAAIRAFQRARAIPDGEAGQ